MLNRQYIDFYKNLIEEEKNAQKEFYTKEIVKLNPMKREKKGRAFVNLKAKIKKKGQNPSYLFFKENNETLPYSEINIGDLVLISEKKPLENKITGTIIEKTKKTILVEFNNPNLMIEDSITLDKKLRLDLYLNEISFKRMIDALERLNLKKTDLKDILLMNRKPKLNTRKNIDFLNKINSYNLLNESQKLAIKNSLKEKEFFFVQGPPGTGKTQVGANISLAHHYEGNKILVTSESNNAIDNLLERIVELSDINNQKINILRLGHSSRISHKINEFSLENKSQKDSRNLMIDKINTYIQETILKMEGYKKPIPTNTKGLNNFQIKKMGERNQTIKGISKDDMDSMANWIKLNESLKNYITKKNKLVNDIKKSLIENASIICATNSTSATLHDYKVEFDVLISDEASQAMEPSALIPINLTKKAIFIGDHKQLPPTVLSNEKLSISLFERLFGKVRYVLLETQYRMNDKIMNFSNMEFYENRLSSFKLNKEHKLDKNIFNHEIVLINSESKEENYPTSTSKFNSGEAKIAIDIARKYVNLGYNDIGIITPYVDQIRYILRNLNEEEKGIIEVNSVDGFQGREKEIIINSFVRSNNNKNLGFLEDLRRLNVALTRAKKQEIIIANIDTITSNKTYNKLVNYIKENGEINYSYFV